MKGYKKFGAGAVIVFLLLFVCNLHGFAASLPFSTIVDLPQDYKIYEKGRVESVGYKIVVSQKGYIDVKVDAPKKVGFTICTANGKGISYKDIFGADTLGNGLNSSYYAVTPGTYYICPYYGAKNFSLSYHFYKSMAIKNYKKSKAIKLKNNTIYSGTFFPSDGWKKNLTWYTFSLKKSTTMSIHNTELDSCWYWVYNSKGKCMFNPYYEHDLKKTLTKKLQKGKYYVIVESMGLAGADPNRFPGGSANLGLKKRYLGAAYRLKFTCKNNKAHLYLACGNTNFLFSSKIQKRINAVYKQLEDKKNKVKKTIVNPLHIPASLNVAEMKKIFGKCSGIYSDGNIELNIRKHDSYAYGYGGWYSNIKTGTKYEFEFVRTGEDVFVLRKVEKSSSKKYLGDVKCSLGVGKDFINMISQNNVYGDKGKIYNLVYSK